MSRKHSISKKQADRLYRTMKDLHDVLISNDVAYWVTGGSLIGAIRHRGIIPWDDDGDICIMRKDVRKFRRLIPTFKEMGYKIEEGDEEDDVEDEELLECRRKRNSCTWFLEPKGKNSLGVDIFVMERIGPIITFSDPYWRTAPNGGEACFFLQRFTFPLVPVPFGNFWVMTPFNAIEHLNQCYGPDWNSMSQRLYDHRSGKWINSTKKRMSVEDYETIRPPKSTCELDPPAMTKCMRAPRASKKIDNLTPTEIRKIAKLYNLKGKNTKTLRTKIAKLA
jgi:hypothetical protein